MAPRSAQNLSRGSYHPPNDATTYRDLLLFEERLKTTAAALQRRKSRYTLFLAQLLIVIAFLLCEVLLQTSFLDIPYNFILCQFLPEIYTPETEVSLHPYFASGLLFVSVTTLVLFFASGMYSEKIAYANQYVPHANKALRSFNMHLNVRKPPLRSKFPFNPFSFLFPRPEPPPSSSNTPTLPRTPTPGRSLGSSSVPIPPIPPTTNPRGELIFSSRVDRSFRESYERYRAAFERKRGEKERLALAATWIGWLLLKLPWRSQDGTLPSQAPPNSPARQLSVPPKGKRTPTPANSRRSSPVPRSIRGSGSRMGTPLSDRMRGESVGP